MPVLTPAPRTPLQQIKIMYSNVQLLLSSLSVLMISTTWTRLVSTLQHKIINDELMVGAISLENYVSAVVVKLVELFFSRNKVILVAAAHTPTFFITPSQPSYNHKTHFPSIIALKN